MRFFLNVVHFLTSLHLMSQHQLVWLLMPFLIQTVNFFYSLIVDFLGLSLISWTTYQSPLLWLLLLCLNSDDWNAQCSIQASLFLSNLFLLPTTSTLSICCQLSCSELSSLTSLQLYMIISFWMSNRRLKLNISKTSFSVSPPDLFLPVFPVKSNSMLPFA